MALTDTDMIDLITKPLPDDACKLVMYVIDSEQPHNERQRYQLFVDKLIGYASYMRSDGFHNEYPEVLPQDILIQVLYKWPPNQKMLEIVSICDRGDPSSGTPVVFEDYDSFSARLRER